MKVAMGLMVAAGLLVGTSAFAEVDKKIQRTYKAKCASCHGADGKGETEQGKKMKVRDMTSAEYQKGLKDADIKKAIEDGINKEKDGVKQEMDAYKDSLKPEQIDGLVQMVRSFGAK